ncbi:MAG: helix-turn-helix domain-containing protein [bacterium]|nr:helix-turn-helix domain-containing protein [bacterium]
MTNELISQLGLLGLSENEAKLFITLLEVGANPVSVVARKAEVTRTTAYAALETLMNKGLVSLVEKNGIQQYAPVSTQMLERYAREQRDHAEANLKLVREMMPQLKSLTGELVMAPKVKYFEGVEGIKNIYQDTLEVLGQLAKEQRVKYAYSSAPQVSDELRDYLDHYIEERRRLKIQIRGIFPDTSASRRYIKSAKRLLALVRIMPKDLEFRFDAEISIYGDKVAIMSLKGDRLHGVIVESLEISATQRAIFELAWRGCGK